MARNEKGRPGKGSPILNAFVHHDAAESNSILARFQETKKNCAQFPINARDFIRCERDHRGGRTIIRIVRVKPCSSGGVRAAGPLIEFADKHLASVIAILQVLQESEAGNA